MTRNILCVACSNDSKKHYGGKNPYPDELIEYVEGFAKINFICDRCGTKINLGAPAVAQSIFKRGKYFKWESDYLNEVKESG